MSLSKDEKYLKTFLERAKGSALDIVVDRGVPIRTMVLLPPLTKQIRTLDFFSSGWEDIQRFSEATSGSLPLLHTLTIDITKEDSPSDFEGTTPSPPLLSGATNLRALHFRSRLDQSPFIHHLVFTNLVSLDLSIAQREEFHASRLFDFLEGSPMLQIVNMEVLAAVSFEGVPGERIVSLPSVEEFTLVVSEGGPGFRIATHIHCPSAKSTAITRKVNFSHTFLAEIFPPLVPWNAIVRQYTRSPVEEATLKILPGLTILTCKLTFWSPDSTTINLGFKVPRNIDGSDVLSTEGWIHEILVQAIWTIKNHPHLANLKRLRICHSFRRSSDERGIGNAIGRLFHSLGPLDEMTIYRCDLRPYLRPFLQAGNWESVVFPSIKELTISHPINLPDCSTAIMELAKSQHARGIPFERVVIQSARMVEGMEEGLRPWVGSVKYCCEPEWRT